MRISGITGLALLAVSITGCGGSGGGGALAFLSFLGLVPNETYQMPAQAIVAPYQVQQVTGDVIVDPSTQSDATVTFGLDGVGDVTNAQIDIPPGPGFGTPKVVRFDTANGDVFADADVIDPLTADYVVAVSASGDQIALVGDPIAMGFQFQTFGIWATGLNGTMGDLGAATAGSRTPQANIPALTGMASYTGMSTGFFIDPNGDLTITVADFGADLNFDTLDIDVATMGTQGFDIVTGIPVAMPGLDFDGSGLLAADGTFSAGIMAVDDLAGNMNGLLYGGNAQELGATFDMSGTGGRHLGSVGARQ